MPPLLLVAVFMLGIVPTVRGQWETEWLVRQGRHLGNTMPAPASLVQDRRNDVLYSIGWQLGQILKSTDKGQTWQTRFTLFTDITPIDPVMMAFDDGTLFYQGQTTYNVWATFVSRDGGSTWAWLSQNPKVMRPDGDVNRLVDIVPPSAILLGRVDRDDSVWVSSDAGRTWRDMAMPDLGGVEPLRRQSAHVAPGVLAWRSATTWLRFDMLNDSTFRPATVPVAVDHWVEARDGAVVARAGRTLMVRRSADEAFVAVDSVAGSTGVFRPLHADSLIRYSDSLILVIDRSGLVVRIDVPRRSTQVLIDVTDAVAEGRPMDVVEGHRTILATVEAAAGNSLRGMTYRLVDIERTTVTTSAGTALPSTYFRRPGSLSLVDDSILVAIGDFPASRVIVRSTDLGRTWHESAFLHGWDDRHTTVYLPVMTAGRYDDSTMVLVTTDHTVMTQGPEGAPHVRRFAASDAVAWYPPAPADQASNTRWRRPVPVIDSMGLIAFTPFVTRIDPMTGETIDTLLPRTSSLFRRLDGTTVAAGRDSLWLTYNNGDEWYYLHAGLPSGAGRHRPGVGDVALASDGSLVVGLRGYGSNLAGEGYQPYVSGGVYRSTDRGASFSAVVWPDSLPFVHRILRCSTGTLLACADGVALRTIEDSLRPNDDLTAYVVERSCIVRSTDDGRTWTIVASDGAGHAQNNIDRTIVDLGTVIMALTSRGYVAVSTDDGRTWFTPQILGLDQDPIHDIVVDRDGSLLLATGRGLARLQWETTSAAGHSGGRPVKDVDLDVRWSVSAQTLAMAAASGGQWLVVDVAGRILEVGRSERLVVSTSAWPSGVVYVVHTDRAGRTVIPVVIHR